MPPPDLVIYLQTPTDVLRRRLKDRARADPDAPALDDEYLRELNEAYNHFFFHYTATPLLVVETSQFDLAWGDEALDDLDEAASAAWARARGTTCRARDEAVGFGAFSRLLVSSAMAWFKKVRKPIEPLAKNKPSRVPEGLWVKCPSCGEVIYNKDLAATLNVCPKCAHHFRIGAAERLRMLFDGELDGVRHGPRSRPTR